MRMYILIKKDTPIGFALVAAAHASLACYLKFKDSPEITDWLTGPFFKTVCKVSATEFEKAKEAGDYVSITESALDGQEIALAFKPREEYPKGFKFFKLWR